MSIQPSCAGIIVLNESKTKTILVKTNNSDITKRTYSFPKGSRKGKETHLETAWRELEEETGLNKDKVLLLDENYIDETNRKGNPNVRYFVGICQNGKCVFTHDEEELCMVNWFTITDALKIDRFSDERKELLKKVIQ